MGCPFPVLDDTGDNVRKRRRWFLQGGGSGEEQREREKRREKKGEGAGALAWIGATLARVNDEDSGAVQWLAGLLSSRWSSGTRARGGSSLGQ